MHDTSLTCSSNFQQSADQGLYESEVYFFALIAWKELSFLKFFIIDLTYIDL